MLFVVHEFPLSKICLKVLLTYKILYIIYIYKYMYMLSKWMEKYVKWNEDLRINANVVLDQLSFYYLFLFCVVSSLLGSSVANDL